MVRMLALAARLGKAPTDTDLAGPVIEWEPRRSRAGLRAGGGGGGSATGGLRGAHGRLCGSNESPRLEAEQRVTSNVINQPQVLDTSTCRCTDRTCLMPGGGGRVGLAPRRAAGELAAAGVLLEQKGAAAGLGADGWRRLRSGGGREGVRWRRRAGEAPRTGARHGEWPCTHISTLYNRHFVIGTL